MSDSDDSFLDIPLSQRIGLTGKTVEDCFANLPDKNKYREPDPIIYSDDSRTPVKGRIGISPLSSPYDSRTPTKNYIETDDDSVIFAGEFRSPVKKRIDFDPLAYDADGFKTPKKKSPSTSEPRTPVRKYLEPTPSSDEVKSPVKKARTPDKAAKLKAEREKKRIERAEAKLVREKMKQKDKEKKAALREAGKAKQITDCHKFCTTHCDLNLLEKFNLRDELETIFREKESKLTIDADNFVDFGIRWMVEQKEIIEEGDEEEESTVNLIRRDVEADFILKVLDPHDYIPLVNRSISKIELESSDDEFGDEDPFNTKNQTLYEYVTSLLDTYEKNLILIFFGYDKYWNKQKNRENAEYQAKMGMAKKRTAKSKEMLPLVKKCDLELALFDLQVKLNESASFSSKRVHITQSEAASHLAHLIWSHTRSIAMCSIKKSHREQQGLEWYAQNDAFGSVDIQTDADITSLWIKQLMTFTKMSEEMARAVAKVYPCVQSLLTAYKQCTGPEEMETLLSVIEVSRKNYTTGNTCKKLGHQVSRRIYQYFTTRDGEFIID